MSSTQLLRSKRKAYLANLEVALTKTLACLKSIPEVQKVILFGSYPSGKKDLFTDLDLLIVMDSSQDFISRTAHLYPRLGAGVDMDIIVYTPDEYARLQNNNFWKYSLRNSKVLYEKR